MIRTGSAVWNGSGKEGSGTVSTASSVLNNAQYSYNTRFADGIGTNPEELVAAAHASCYSMKLSFILVAAGFTPDTLSTKCEVTFENGAITKSHLIVEGKVPGASKEQFDTAVKEAAETCPISKSLNAAISSEGTLL